MPSSGGVSLFGHVVAILVSFLCLEISAFRIFDQVYTGVTFTPFIKLPPSSTYTIQDVKAMLEVISERFSKVATWSAGSRKVIYIHNETYYHDSSIEAFIPEIAATINQERGNKSLTILQGVWLHEGFQMNTATRLALESAQKANAIFPGTVEGIVFSRNAIPSGKMDEELLKYIELSKGNGLKLGIRMKCNDLRVSSLDTWKEDFKTVLRNSNFISCGIDQHHWDRQEAGTTASFQALGDWLLQLRENLRHVNSDLEVMGQAKWSSSGESPWYNVAHLKSYWELASQWAKNNSFPIWFHEAFDNPTSSEKHNGWWKLIDNEKSDSREGYVEKIAIGNAVRELRRETSTSSNNDVTEISTEQLLKRETLERNTEVPNIALSSGATNGPDITATNGIPMDFQFTKFMQTLRWYLEPQNWEKLTYPASEVQQLPEASQVSTVSPYQNIIIK